MSAVLKAGSLRRAVFSRPAYASRTLCRPYSLVTFRNNANRPRVGDSCTDARPSQLACGYVRPATQPLTAAARLRQRGQWRVLSAASEVSVEEVAVRAPVLTPPDVGPLPGYVEQGPLDTAKGTLMWLAVMAASLPIWIREGAKLGFGYVATGGKLFDTKDRSDVEFPDPFPGVVHDYVDVNNVRLHIVRAAPKKAGQKLMLMVHGFPESWYSWHNQMKEFKDDYEVVAFDMRGYGKSSKPEGRENYRIEFLVADVAALIHALGHESCVLVAHDWGGSIAWVTAALHPNMVEKLVVCALPHPTCWMQNMDADQMKRSWYIQWFQAPALPELAFKVQDFASIDGLMGKFSSPTHVEGLKAYLAMPGSLTAIITYYRALFDVTYRRASPQYVEAQKRLKAGELPMPVLMLFAENDMALGTQLLKGTEDVVPNLELHVLPSGHWINQEKPEEVNSLMRSFLAKSK